MVSSWVVEDQVNPCDHSAGSTDGCLAHDRFLKPPQSLCLTREDGTKEGGEAEGWAPCSMELAVG